MEPDRLRAANLAFAARYPGDTPLRQPVHTVYGGAHLFRRDTARMHGEAALAALEAYAPDASTFAAVVGLEPQSLAERVYARVLEKLRREPVEDFRLDFEDGYGNRDDAEEDHHAVFAAEEVATGMATGELPTGIGLRLKPLTEELWGRSLRTLEIFLTTLLERSGGELPSGFIVTLAKVTIPEQTAYFSERLERLEREMGLADGSLCYEVMVEVPQAVLNHEGRSPLVGFWEASAGRMVAAHLGVYDYTASLGITAAQQRLRHPVCDFARHVMQVAFSGTGVRVSDGSTALLPVPLPPPPGGSPPNEDHARESREQVHRAWKLHFDDVGHSLGNGFYQGWDLHPAQLPTRFAAVYAFFLAGQEAAGSRLQALLRPSSEGVSGGVFDDVATGQALLGYFLRGIHCGASTPGEVAAMTGLTPEELRESSFARILERRRR